MRTLYLDVTSYLGQQRFQGIVRGHSMDLNIDYQNSNLIDVEISNIVNNHSNLVGKVVDLIITTENPVKGKLAGYIIREASLIQFIQ
jgi:hypothetical protein